ncbi:uncharacterized protein Dvir_GJ27011 [Drosophila virilis]|uniref:Uncharacterized protein n=1 Tax=Drosophila virilis TaxID=7244 RepID=A0A0Q9WEH4_DROVI|nr:uncharacterized protein Dvir_GJ27011 [Drosophila virilis]
MSHSKRAWNQKQQQKPNQQANHSSRLIHRRATGSTVTRPMRQNNRAGAGAGAGAAYSCGFGLWAPSLLLLLLLLQLLAETQSTPSPSSMQTPQKRGKHLFFFLLFYSCCRREASQCRSVGLVPCSIVVGGNGK